MRFLALCLLGTLLPLAALAQAPARIAFQGSLDDASGPVTDPSATLTFRLYDAAANGTAVWTETHTGVSIDAGAFGVRLGAASASTGAALEALDMDRPLWVSVAVGDASAPELPRSPLTASPVALALPGVSVREVNTSTGDRFVGINRTSRVTVAEYFGIGSAATSGYVGMYISGSGPDVQPFYGYAPTGTTTGTVFHYLNPSDSRWSLFNGGNRLNVLSNGRVGIGTIEPTQTLDVRGAVYTEAGTGGTDPAATVVANGEGFGVFSEIVDPDRTNPNAALGAEHSGLGPALYARHTGTGEAGQFRGGEVSVLDGAGTAAVVLDPDGQASGGTVRVYDSDGQATVELLADENGNDGAELRLRQADGTLTVAIDAELGAGGGARADFYDSAGTNTVQILTEEGTAEGAQITLRRGTGQATIELDAEYGGGGGHGRIDLYDETGTRTLVLDAGASSAASRVTVDEVRLNGSDLAEHFVVRDAGTAIAPEPGTVLSIDPEAAGGLVVSGGAYERTVAGIVSGAGGVRPGILMSQPGTLADGDVPVAIAGRVYVRADASNGPIRPGDLLTTAHRPGHAMRADDAERARGATLGKAMSALDAGTGLVLVLVVLQ
ncbi:MAG: hypothetical protein AAF594_06275 [Bacteroidota bacterium]